MSFGIAVINHGRPTVLRLFLASIDRLRSQFGYFPVVCVSGAEDKDICTQHLVFHVIYANQPVSLKWNIAFDLLRQFDVDYGIIVGSDDILSNDLMSSLIDNMNKGYDLIGVNKIYFYGTYGECKGLLYHLERPGMLGVCKTISRTILDEIDWKVCDKECNHAIDGAIHKKIVPYVRSMSFAEGAVVDVKTRDNMNHITFWASKLKPLPSADIFYDYLSEQELKILHTL